MKITIGREQLLNLNESLKKEYLLTNGNGAFASSTVIDCHTRKYHGLLAVPLKDRGATVMLLSKLECAVSFNKHEHKLSTNKFPGVFSPTGHQYITKFESEYLPETTYKLGEVEIKKTSCMPRFMPTVLVRFRLTAAKRPVLLKIMPFLAYRNIHELIFENTFVRPRTYFEENGFKIDPYEGLPALYMQTSHRSVFYPAPGWWKDFEYIEEQNRGYNYKEDLFTPGVFEVKLKPGQEVIIRASIKKQSAPIKEEWDTELARIKKETSRFAGEPEPLSTLKLHAEHYLTDNHTGIIAGYHWFGEWGRDTMISLPGITLCRGEKETALNILSKYARYVKNGLLPNVTSTDNNHAYNSIDTSLLFFRSIQKYLEYTGDKAGVKERLGKCMAAILDAVINNKTQISHTAETGIVFAGTARTQLTWMDANAYGAPVTPRHGAAVEINALFYNALCFILSDFAALLTAPQKQLYAEIKQKFEASFETLFWNPQTECLIDVYRNDQDKETHIRPNQLFAVGLDYTCIQPEKAQKIIAVVKQHLVTPYGLRTLSPQDPLYLSDYSGDQDKRDSAYHQGMVWPWLIGIFYDACIKYGSDRGKTRTYFQNTFKELWSTHLAESGLFHISEIFNPTPPFMPNGAVAQAWSMAEAIRVLNSLETKE
ncbi:MAG: amylo-alpha-1,6-glucosidase [Spirochaetia bacterium]